MASAREIKKRIRSVKNISQITRAMEAVSASRVRRAQARVLASRAYSEKAWEILLNIQNFAAKGTLLHPLLAERTEVKSAMVVLITADRGLAGAYNTNIVRVAQRFAQRLGKPVKFVTVGRKGRDSLIHAGENVIAEFSDLPADPTTDDIAPVARLAIDEFLRGAVDQVFIAYTDFINTLTQRPVVLGWLPLIPYTTEDQVAAEFVKDVPSVSGGAQDYEYEPSAAAILDEIVPRFTELQLYQAVLESQASEHSARMVAMRNASDNATQLTADLTLVYNKARQSAITAEILDIVGGAEALQDTIDKAADQILAAYHEAMQTTNGTNGKSKPAPKKKAKKASAGGDDLTRIEGIGPKMSAALQAAGITTFAQLAGASEETLTAAIEAAGIRLAPSLGTWAEQAAFAAKGDWDGLKQLQDTLIGGRKA
ncbi:MAG: ATP synthase F1 subunit gamma [Anaerolineaceae bacterium]|nr:ATP synthase F1 subunit gamma [Anaerolineaceae bacterium]